jgi:hypothetical protein
MKKSLLLCFCSLAILSCRDEKPETDSPKEPVNETVVEADLYRYPVPYQEVLLAHGGLDQWKKMRSLTYSMPSDGGDEVQTIDLESRKVLVETDTYKMGSDGKELWIQQDSTYFNPERVEFYHNLMFYFYAMPFVLADDGITYAPTEPLIIEGKTYPGMKVSYEENIGASPEDEYLLFMDPKTKNMAWLAYTVTFGKDEKSDLYNFIKYDKWQEVNGLQLPAAIVWYNVKDGKPTTPAGPPRTFVQVDIDEAPMDAATYSKPATAMLVKKQ